jgi:hypothetical protein
MSEGPNTIAFLRISYLSANQPSPSSIEPLPPPSPFSSFQPTGSRGAAGLLLQRPRGHHKPLLSSDRPRSSASLCQPRPPFVSPLVRIDHARTSHPLPHLLSVPPLVRHRASGSSTCLHSVVLPFTVTLIFRFDVLPSIRRNPVARPSIGAAGHRQGLQTDDFGCLRCGNA